MYSSGQLYTDKQRLDDQLKLIYNNSVLIHNVGWKTCPERWTIVMNDVRGSGKSVLAATHDDDDDDDDDWIAYY